MNNSFRNDCYLFINDIKDKHLLNKREILLWIYFNMHFYRQAPSLIDEDYNKYFMEYLKKYRHFNIFYEKYEKIQEMECPKLLSSVLKKHVNNDNLFPSSQVMEHTYEKLIQESLRTKSGSYYTPQPIVKYITVQSILYYIDSQINNNKESLKDYILGKTNTLSFDYILQTIQLLKGIRIIDIACGGGVFLRQSLQFLYTLNKTLFQLIGKDYNDKNLLKQILQNNLYGVDIQEETAILCKLLLTIEAESLCKSSIGDIDLHIFNEDVLSMDFAKTIGEKDGFHIVLGNPPYIGEKGNKSLFQAIRLKEFGEKYYERNMDYFYFFIYKAYEILIQKGIIGYITTNYFVTADGAKKLRGFLKSNLSFKEIINCNTLNLFDDAKGQHNMIFLLEKSQTKEPVRLINFSIDTINVKDLYEILLQEKQDLGIEIVKVHKDKLYDNKGQISIQYFGDDGKILEKIEKKGNYLLEDLCYINQGIVSGADRLTASWATKLGLEKDIGNGIFVLNKEELDSLNLDEHWKNIYVKDFYKNSDIKRYYTLKNKDLYLLYIDDQNLADLHQIPNLHKHFSKYRAILQQRREVQKGTRKWYALQWPRNNEIFIREKIVVPQRSLKNSFSYVEGPWYASADVYYITAKNKDISLYYLLGLLNSSVMHYWLYYRGKRKGEYLELYATPLKRIPIYYSPNDKKCDAIEDLVKHIIKNIHDKNTFFKTQMKIDRFVSQIYGLMDIEDKDMMNFIRKNQYEY